MKTNKNERRFWIASCARKDDVGDDDVLTIKPERFNRLCEPCEAIQYSVIFRHLMTNENERRK